MSSMLENLLNSESASRFETLVYQESCESLSMDAATLQSYRTALLKGRIIVADPIPTDRPKKTTKRILLNRMFLPSGMTPLSPIAKSTIATQAKNPDV